MADAKVVVCLYSPNVFVCIHAWKERKENGHIVAMYMTVYAFILCQKFIGKDCRTGSYIACASNVLCRPVNSRVQVICDAQYAADTLTHDMSAVCLFVLKWVVHARRLAASSTRMLLKWRHISAPMTIITKR